MLDLQISEKNLLVISDQRLGIKIGIFYRDPEPKDYIEFKSKLTKMLVNKASTEELLDYQVKYSMEFMTGVREDDLSYGGKKVSTNAEDENYKKDWKELLYKKAFKVLQKFSEAVFGDYSTAVVKEEADFLVN